MKLPPTIQHKIREAAFTDVISSQQVRCSWLVSFPALIIIVFISRLRWWY